MSDYADYISIKENILLIMRFTSRIHIVKSLKADVPTIPRDRRLHGIILLETTERVESVYYRISIITSTNTWARAFGERDT